jgi:hypothetical protein
MNVVEGFKLSDGELKKRLLFDAKYLTAINFDKIIDQAKQDFWKAHDESKEWDCSPLYDWFERWFGDGK